MESVKDAAKCGRTMTVTGKTNVPKHREIVGSHGRHTNHDIAKVVGISLSFHFDVCSKCTKYFARWIPHDQNQKQKQKTRIRVLNAMQLLKMFLKINQRQFANNVTDDET
jgi:hypothetical protein